MSHYIKNNTFDFILFFSFSCEICYPGVYKMKNKHSLLVLLESGVLACILMLFPLRMTHAVSVVERSFDELFQRADDVIYGQVTDIYSQQLVNEQGGQIFTFVQFSNIKRVKNEKSSSKETYLLRIAGGRVVNTVQMYPGIPQFVLGEHYVIFVRDNEKTAFPLVGIQQGLIHARTKSDGRVHLLFNASNRKLKTHFLDLKNRRSQTVDEKNIDPEDFIATLREYWLSKK